MPHTTNYKLVHHFLIWKGSSEELTISTSLYSPNTSKVDLRVPLRTVGSSEERIKIVSHWLRVRRRARGMIVRRLRRSAKPILLVSRLSISIRPSVGSTKRKNERARVLFPEPVRPRMPTYVVWTSDQWFSILRLTFSPGLISKLRWWSTSGKSGCHRRVSKGQKSVDMYSRHIGWLGLRTWWHREKAKKREASVQ